MFTNNTNPYLFATPDLRHLQNLDIIKPVIYAIFNSNIFQINMDTYHIKTKHLLSWSAFISFEVIKIKPNYE